MRAAIAERLRLVLPNTERQAALKAERRRENGNHGPRCPNCGLIGLHDLNDRNKRDCVDALRSLVADTELKRPVGPAPTPSRTTGASVIHGLPGPVAESLRMQLREAKSRIVALENRVDLLAYRLRRLQPSTSGESP